MRAEFVPITPKMMAELSNLPAEQAREPNAFRQFITRRIELDDDE